MDEVRLLRIGEVATDELYRVSRDGGANVGLHEDTRLTDFIRSECGRADYVVRYDGSDIEIGGHASGDNAITGSDDAVENELVVVVVIAVRRRADGRAAHDDTEGRVGVVVRPMPVQCRLE